MKKKKGFTLMELMISVSMIAIIMVFLVKLLIDINAITMIMVITLRTLRGGPRS